MYQSIKTEHMSHRIPSRLFTVTRELLNLSIISATFSWIPNSLSTSKELLCVSKGCNINNIKWVDGISGYSDGGGAVSHGALHSENSTSDFDECPAVSDDSPFTDALQAWPTNVTGESAFYCNPRSEWHHQHPPWSVSIVIFIFLSMGTVLHGVVVCLLDWKTRG